MDITALNRKQKRVRDWINFVQAGGVQEPKLRTTVLQTVEAYKRVLAKCWQCKTIATGDEAEMADLERKLEQLNEESRMTTVGKRGGIPAQIF